MKVISLRFKSYKNNQDNSSVILSDDNLDILEKWFCSLSDCIMDNVKKKIKEADEYLRFLNSKYAAVFKT